MKKYKNIFLLLAAAIIGMLVSIQVQACEPPVHHDHPVVKSVARVAVAPVRVTRSVLTRTVVVSVPTVTTDCCGEVSSVGCTTACVQAVFFPRLKAMRLATGHSVSAQSSSVSTVTQSRSVPQEPLPLPSALETDPETAPPKPN